MADFAAQADRKARLRLRVRRHRTAHHLRDREISVAVGQFDHLFEQAVRRVEGRMHVPQRAGAAEFRERKRAGGESFGDVAGIVDAQQEERHAPRVRPLQRGQAMAHLFEAGVEALRQHVDVVVQRLGRAVERLIGHHDSGGEIIRQRNAVEPPRRIVEGTGSVDDGVDAGAAFGEANLQRELEGAARAVDQFGDQQLPAMPVEPPQRLAHHVNRHDAGDDRMFFAQAGGERSEQLLGGDVQFVAQILRGLFELRKIVAVGLDQIAHALDRVGLEAGALVAVGHLRRHQRLAAAGLGIGGIQTLQVMSHTGAQFGEVAQLLLGQVDLAEQWIGEDLVQLGKEPVLIGGGEVAQIEVVGLGQPQQYLRRHRALVPLYQVDIARRNAQPLGDLGLRQPELLADPPEAGAHEEFLSGVGGHGRVPSSFNGFRLSPFFTGRGRRAAPGEGLSPRVESPSPRPSPREERGEGGRRSYAVAATTATFGAGREIASTISAATMQSAPAMKNAGR